MEKLIQRVLVSLVLVPLLLFAVLWEQTWLFKALVFLALAAAMFEFFGMADRRGMKTLRVEGVLVLGLVLLPSAFSFAAGLWEPWPFALGVVCLPFLWGRRPLETMAVSAGTTFLGAAYFGVLGSYFFRLRGLADGDRLLIWLFLATWAYDTGGFFGGHWFGKHKLAPGISPGKTWEGCIGGLLLTTVVLFALYGFVPFYYGEFSATEVAALALLLSVAGQLGDLVESALKRSLSAKDSGSTLPGHGGLFDRIDSLLFTAPVLFYYLKWMAGH